VRRIPPSIWVSLSSLAVAMVAIAWLTVRAGQGGPAWGQVAFAAVIGALLLGGLLSRRRLAWLWGSSLALLLALVQAAALGLAVYRHVPLPPRLWLLLGSITAALLLAGLTLRRRSALAWFDLVCPACLTPTGLGADFLFRQARCRRCGNVW